MRSDGVIGCVLVPVAFYSAKRQVADMMRSASAQFVERDFGSGLPQRVRWSNYFANVPVPSVLSKGFERILYDQVLEHINGCNLYAKRRGHSNTTALVRVSEDLRSAKAEKKVTVHVLLDFSKAFDLINHGLFHNSAMGMVSSFLKDRSYGR
jgi:hypothetical protein